MEDSVECLSKVSLSQFPHVLVRACWRQQSAAFSHLYSPKLVNTVEHETYDNKKGNDLPLNRQQHTWNGCGDGEEIRPGLRARVGVSGGTVRAGNGRRYDRVLERDGVVDQRSVGCFAGRREQR